ncbi:MAG TPA: nucleoside hydrolase [Polyangiaceae bacterium]|nr:nucleoside hydrolase [Polyangiaceae bacterium]
MPIPVILDTDIGSDIDDTWALAQLLRCPELDLKLVLTATGDVRYRAGLTAKLLERAGRSDVPVGLGKDFGPMEDKARLQDAWLREYELERYPGKVIEDGVGALIDIVMNSPVPVTLIAIAPVPNLSLALEREPRIAERCRFVGMHGSIDCGFAPGSPPGVEYNVKCEIEGFRRVLAAPWQDLLLTPLDTCARATLTGDKYRSVWSRTDDPLVRSVIENYCLWAPRASWFNCDFFATGTSTLFDCVAVYLAYAEDLVEVESLGLSVADDGLTVRDPNGSKVRAAMRWKDLGAFEDHLVQTLLGSRTRAP